MQEPAGDTAQRESTLKWKRRALVIWALVGVCALMYVLGILLEVLSVPVSIIIWCIIFTFCLSPIVDVLQKRGVGRGLGTTLAFVALAVCIGLLFLMLFLPGIGASSQFVTLAQNLPGYIAGVEEAFKAFSVQYADILQNPTVQSWISQVSTSLSNFLGEFANAAGSSIVGFGSFVANTAMIIGFALVISFWILMELPGIQSEMRRLVKPERLEDFAMLTETLTRVIGGYLKATLLQCFIIGLGCGIGYAILGLPGPAALGIITGILNIIPVVGPWIGGLVAAIVGFTVSPIAALIAIVIAVVIQQVVYTFVSPMLMSDSVDIHPVLVIFGLTCGSAIGGTMAGLSGSILGMLASIPLIAAGKALFVYYYERRTGRRIVSPDGVFFKGEVADGDSGSVDPTLDAAAPTPQRQVNLQGKELLPEKLQAVDPKAVREKLEEKRRKRLEQVTQAIQDSEDSK